MSKNNTINITLPLPEKLHLNLLKVQEFLKSDLQKGEKIPTIESLIIQAVEDAYGGEMD